MNQEVLNYIKQSLEQRKTKEQIWEALKRTGWQENDIKRAFQESGLMEPNQQNPPMPPTPSMPSPASKEWTGKETVSVVFLVLLPIVGLILMWTIANWSKKVKIIITVALLLPIIAIGGILSSIVLVSMGGAREAARDAVRKADMRQIVTAQELYYMDSNQYYQSVNYPINIPGAFEFEMPMDPKTEGPYSWIDNAGNNQKFCAYADLEKDDFYVATQGGNGEIETEPRTLSDCEEFFGFYSY